MNIYDLVFQAEERIRPFIRETPLEYSFYLSKLAECNVYLKLDNLQYTGSFKMRGATNKLLSLSNKERKKGVLAASTGNHGMGVAYGLRRFDIKGEIYLPENSLPQKINMLRDYGAELVFHGDDCAITEAYARTVSTQTGKVFISPYNDEQIIAGQGTLAVELKRQLTNVDAVFVAVGGGGLISGIGGFLKEKNRRTQIIGCLPKNSPVMYESIKAGEIVEMPALPTLSDGTAGGVEAGAITFSLCQKYVDDWITVTEEEIESAMRLVFEQHRLVIEGAAGVAVAAFMRSQNAQKFGKKANVVIVLCGGNVDMEKFKSIVL